MKRHVLKCNSFLCFCTTDIKAVVTVILCTELCRIRDLGANQPGRFVSTCANKGQIFIDDFRTFLIKRVRSLAKINCITALCSGNCIGKVIRRYYIILRQCHDRQHADQHDQRQQTG